MIKASSKQHSKLGIRRALRIMISSVLAAGSGYLAISTGLSAHELLDGQAENALWWRPTSTDAALMLANKTFSSGDHQQARALALLAIRDAPINSQAVTLLARIAGKSGQQDRSKRLWTHAGALGYENAAAQRWVLHQALQQNQTSIAVYRAEALVRQGAYENEAYPILRQLAGKPEGLDLLAQRLAERPLWRSAYLGNLAGLSPAGYQAHLALLEKLTKTSAPPQPQEIAAFLSRLIADKRFVEAFSAGRRLAPADATSGIRDANFQYLAMHPVEPAPLGWQLSDVPGLSVEAIPGSGLSIRVEGTAYGTVASQLAPVDSGIYDATINGQESEPGSAAALDAKLTCAETGLELQGKNAWRRADQTGKVVLTKSFEVAGCSAASLELLVSNVAPERVDLTVTKLLLRPRR
jgi:hypothetical protein